MPRLSRVTVLLLALLSATLASVPTPAAACTIGTSPTFECLAQPIGPMGVIVCFPYNEDAWTNACLVQEQVPVYVVGPWPTTGPHTECIVGDQCVTVPMPGVEERGWIVPVPVPDGYVEVTMLCNARDGSILPCRVTV